MELVEFDVGLMLAEQQKNAPDIFPYMYEMPRELARSALTAQFLLKASPACSETQAKLYR